MSNEHFCAKCNKKVTKTKAELKKSKTGRHFCSKSCSASFNNTIRKRKPKKQRSCLNCGRLTSNAKYCSVACSNYRPKRKCKHCAKEITSKKYCSNTCQREHEWAQYREEIEEAGSVNPRGSKTISKNKVAKKYLMETRGYCCEICGTREWMGKPVGLILDHIDGNSENDSLSNVRLVCGNCDMQLPTYKSKNKGNGRHSRRKRYKDGKSY